MCIGHYPSILLLSALNLLKCQEKWGQPWLCPSVQKSIISCQFLWMCNALQWPMPLSTTQHSTSIKAVFFTWLTVGCKDQTKAPTLSSTFPHHPILQNHLNPITSDTPHQNQTFHCHAAGFLIGCWPPPMSSISRCSNTGVIQSMGNSSPVS